MFKVQQNISTAQALLTQAESGTILDDDLRKKSLDHTNPGAQPKLLERQLEVKALEEKSVEVKLQGVDVAGLFAWIKGQLVPERRGLAFTAHIAPDGVVTIAGNVKDLGIEDVDNIYLASKPGRSPVAALDDIALHLFRLRTENANQRLRSLPLDEYRSLIDNLVDTALVGDTYKSDLERKKHYKLLSKYYDEAANQHPDWLALLLLSAEMSRRAGDYISAKKEFTKALDSGSDENSALEKLIRDRIASVTPPAAAESLAPKAAALVAVHQRPVLTNNDSATLERLRDGFAYLYQNIGPASFSSIAGLYGVPGWYAWHHTSNSRSNQRLSLFLAWNRAFLYLLENTARDKIKDFSLACWDWTHEGIPAGFASYTLPSGQPNPLAASFIDIPAANPPIKRKTFRSPASPQQLPSTASVQAALHHRQWDEFSISIESISDSVHGWVAGDMGQVSTSAYDPLFFAHRCNIDRIWAHWQQLHKPLDGAEAIDPNLLDVPLPPFAFKVRDVLDTEKLGYRYD